jgi:hypothetical protein
VNGGPLRSGCTPPREKVRISSFYRLLGALLDDLSAQDRTSER